MEQEEYTKEEINWSYIEFVDNQDVLDLIEKVFAIALHCCHFQFFDWQNTLEWSFNLNPIAVYFFIYLCIFPCIFPFPVAWTLIFTAILFNPLQKPGGIIALLDEAWYAASIWNWFYLKHYCSYILWRLHNSVKVRTVYSYRLCFAVHFLRTVSILNISYCICIIWKNSFGWTHRF